MVRCINLFNTCIVSYIIVEFNFLANDLNSGEIDCSYDDEVFEDCPLLSSPNYVPVESSMMPTPPFDIFLRPSFREN